MKITDLLDKSIGILFFIVGIVIIVSSAAFWIKCISISIWLMILISTLKLAIEKEQHRKQRQKDALDKSDLSEREVDGKGNIT